MTTSKIPSNMVHQFSQVPAADIPRSSFNRSHGLKTTFDAGLLIPIFLDEVLPGDTFNLNMTGFARLATPIKPVMDNMFMETFFFFIPNRLVWEDWQKFNGEQTNPGDSTDFVIPQFTTTGPFSAPNLLAYMGLPTEVNTITYSDLPIRGYNLVFNQWFRDENLQDSAVVHTDDTVPAEAVIHRRGKRHDYFTSCLPFPQKGPATLLPLGDTAPVVPAGSEIPTWLDPLGSEQSLSTPGPAVSDIAWTPNTGNYGAGASKWGSPELEADLTAATAITINQLRQAFQVQKLYERDARGGTRYTEIIRSHFGVVSPDARLQRPEFLGGGSTNINIQPVPQTGFTATDVQTSETPQGNLAGYGTATLNGHGFTKSFTEHGYILGLVSVRADLTYQNGLNKLWSRETRFDFYWPALSHIGEQSVLNREIDFQDGDPASNTEVFGYQERYAEYRYKPSIITGKFKSNDPTSLDVWHLAQDFLTPPALNADFIKDDPPIDRIIAVPGEPHFLFDAYFQLQCARPMPLYGVPGLVDHF